MTLRSLSPDKPSFLRALPTIAALTLAVGAITWSVIWGREVQQDERVKLGAAPLVGEWIWDPSIHIIPAVVVALLTIFGFERLTQRRRWSIASIIAAFLAGAWTFTLAVTDRFENVLNPVVDETEYWANIPKFPGVREMIDRAAEIDYLLNFSVHIKGHPPGFPLMLVGLDNLGVAQPWVIGMLSWAGAAIVVAATMTCIKHLASEEAARTTAPFLILAPYAVWMGTSADAVFAAFLMVGLAFICSALRSERLWRAVPFATVGGLLLGWSLMLTYGAATFMVAPAVAVLGAKSVKWSRRATVAIVGALGFVGVIAVMYAFGFWWREGLTTVKAFYEAGTAQFRPAKYFVLGNIGALFIAIGAAPIAAWVRKRERGIWLLSGSGLLMVTIANASLLSKAETERIWLIFMPLLMTATASLPLTHRRWWLFAQAAAGITLQLWLYSKW